MFIKWGDNIVLQTFFDFCSGIGGGRLGLEYCGLESVGYSETSRLSAATYKLMHDPDNENNIGDLRKAKTEELPDFDILIAGFPCQTFSVIGRKAGFDDSRGQIIFHLARIIEEKKPKCFILENVRGLVTHDDGKTLKIIMKLLSDCGYVVSYRVLSSIDHGVPQMRQRVYFVGIRNDIDVDVKNYIWPRTYERPHLRDYLIDEGNEISEENYGYFERYLKNPTNQGKYKPSDFLDEEYLIIDTRMSDLRLYRGRVPTLRSHRDGIFYIKNHSIRELTGYEALLLQGFPKEYADKVKDVVTNRHLLMQAGNAMTVNVIKELGNSLINLFNTTGGMEMANWMQFESDCFDYLNHNYGGKCGFKAMGKADSTIPDILVSTSKNEFYIEVKEANAQSGQFVLLPDMDGKRFVFSPRNKTAENEFTSIITNYMNDDFERFNAAGTAGQGLDIDANIFYSWIEDYYASKGVRYFITKGHNYIIFPVSKFHNYFDVTAKYRIKRSGSSEPSVKYREGVLQILKNRYGVDDYEIKGKKLFVYGNRDMDKIRFILGDYEYYLAEKDSGKFEVRQLSNTYNMNVIFSISLKAPQNHEDLRRFENDLI